MSNFRSFFLRFLGTLHVRLRHHPVWRNFRSFFLRFLGTAYTITVSPSIRAAVQMPAPTECLGPIPSTPVSLLRWIGGKQRLARILAPKLRGILGDRIYVEPFLGAGAFFFHLTPSSAHLSDSNKRLIDCYRFIRDSPDEVWRAFRPHIRHDSAVHYYKTRTAYNHHGESASQAARFLYLNRTCFNGVYRVNKQGQYNVPYGHKERPRFPTKLDLRHAGVALRAASLSCRPFGAALCDLGPSHFVFLDPPYPPLDRTAFFRHYTAERFEESDQEILSTNIRMIDRRGALFLLTMPDTALVRTLYRGFSVRQLLDVVRYVSCREMKRRVPELLISNFSISP